MNLKILIDPSPLRRQVVERLRVAIVDGELPIGVRLVERELIEALGVSRPSVREALRQLESEGLIVQSSNRGVEIPRLTRKDIVELYEVRIALEGLAAELFAKKASDEQVQSLKVRLEEIEAAREEPENRRRFRESKSGFYEILFEGADNKTAATALRTYHLRLALIWGATSSDRQKEARKAEMREIVEAIERRDSNAAREAYIIHLTNSLEEAVRSVDPEVPELNLRAT